MKLYLAGPDVFRPDALLWAEAVRELLARHGHVALVPLDNDETTAAGIYRANIDQIRRADAVLANLNPFRGAEPDAGTCFEVGYAIALGKRVVGYLDDTRPLIEKLARRGELFRTSEGRPVDREGMAVEHFGLPLNLMLAISSDIVAGGLEAALARIA